MCFQQKGPVGARAVDDIPVQGLNNLPLQPSVPRANPVQDIHTGCYIQSKSRRCFGIQRSKDGPAKIKDRVVSKKLYRCPFFDLLWHRVGSGGDDDLFLWFWLRNRLGWWHFLEHRRGFITCRGLNTCRTVQDLAHASQSMIGAVLHIGLPTQALIDRVRGLKQRVAERVLLCRRCRADPKPPQNRAKARAETPNWPSPYKNRIPQ